MHRQQQVPVRLTGRTVPEPVLRAIVVYVVLYLGLFAVGSVALAADAALRGTPVGLDEAISASAATLGNVGPAFGAAGPMGSFAGYGDPGQGHHGPADVGRTPRAAAGHRHPQPRLLAALTVAIPVAHGAHTRRHPHDLPHHRLDRALVLADADRAGGVALIYGDPTAPFWWTMLIGFVAGSALERLGPARDIGLREGFLVVGLGWLAVGAGRRPALRLRGRGHQEPHRRLLRVDVGVHDDGIERDDRHREPRPRDPASGAR